jgi:hypothetical protein
MTRRKRNLKKRNSGVRLYVRHGFSDETIPKIRTGPMRDGTTLGVCKSQRK